MINRVRRRNEPFDWMRSCVMNWAYDCGLNYRQIGKLPGIECSHVNSFKMIRQYRKYIASLEVKKQEQPLASDLSLAFWI